MTADPGTLPWLGFSSIHSEDIEFLAYCEGLAQYRGQFTVENERRKAENEKREREIINSHLNRWDRRARQDRDAKTKGEYCWARKKLELYYKLRLQGAPRLEAFRIADMSNSPFVAEFFTEGDDKIQEPDEEYNTALFNWLKDQALSIEPF